MHDIPISDVLFIHLQLKECDERLLSIRVPDVISRAPKSINDVSKWKGMLINSYTLQC